MKLRHAILPALLLLSHGAAHAQDAPESPAPLCFRSKPAASCRVFLITEFARNSTEYGARTGSYHVQYEAGAMANVTPRDAVGATLTFGGPHAEHWGLNARYRRWLTRGIGLDVAPGVLVVGDDYDGRRLRITTDVSLSLGGWFAAFARGESGRDGGRSGVGVKLGQLPGVIVGTAYYILDSVVPRT